MITIETGIYDTIDNLQKEQQEESKTIKDCDTEIQRLKDILVEKDVHMVLELKEEIQEDFCNDCSWAP